MNFIPTPMNLDLMAFTKLLSRALHRSKIMNDINSTFQIDIKNTFITRLVDINCYHSLPRLRPSGIFITSITADLILSPFLEYTWPRREEKAVTFNYKMNEPLAS